jgi:hypothetical protein
MLAEMKSGLHLGYFRDGFDFVFAMQTFGGVGVIGKSVVSYKDSRRGSLCKYMHTGRRLLIIFASFAFVRFSSLPAVHPAENNNGQSNVPNQPS